MTFFEPPKDPEPRPSYRDPPWRRAPWGEIPASVPVWVPLAKTATIAFGVSRFEVYSSSCSIVVKGFARHLDPGQAHGPPGLAGSARGMRLGVIWSDGTELRSNVGSPSAATPETPVLLGGITNAGGDTYQEMNAQFWMWPLPPAGEMKLIADWPDQDIPEHSVSVDAGPILSALDRVVRVWEDDRPLRPDAG